MIRRVYLETNSLRGRWPFVQGELRVLATLARNVGARVCIPLSALVEHKHTIVREFFEHAAESATEIAKANLLLRGVTAVQVPEIQQRQAIFDSYDNFVRGAIAHYGLEVVPMTGRTVEDFIRFAAERSAPFK